MKYAKISIEYVILLGFASYLAWFYTLPIWQVLIVLAATICVKLVLAYFFRLSPTNYDGVMKVDTSDPDKDQYSLVVFSPAGEWKDMKEITLQVVNSQ